MLNSRILRRRWVLAVIFIFSLVYFGINVYKQREYIVVSEETPRLRQAMDTFKFLEKTNSTDGICRNSVQGKHLIADDKGFVCKREAVLEGGCCDHGATGVQQFVCDSCINNGCCSVYEHCVSCCLQPEKQPLLRKILGRASDKFQHLFQSVTDHFELCLAKCRTSSQSVQHENSYRDPFAKFCYGESPPDLQAVAP